ncbi:MAG: hypothetical protein M9920_16105 [Verrucomicrobiae bacterium]|nr:hypothetical protein [Verrucomicrobiae bacterium]
MIDTWLTENRAPANKDWAHYKWYCLELNVPALLKKGNDSADGVDGGFLQFCEAQSSRNSYKHAMRAWYQSKTVAKANYDRFILDTLKWAQIWRTYAINAVHNGDYESAKGWIEGAIRYIGEAQHPVADSTSPAHNGFQIWFGIPDGIAILGVGGYTAFVEAHHLRESSSVYVDLGDGPAKMVAREMHSRLLEILQE